MPLSFLTSAQPWYFSRGIALIRIIFGLLLIYHGQEVFQPDLMKTYTDWEGIKGPYASLMVYTGKTMELLAGLLLTFGFYTRIGALFCMLVLSYVTFGVGKGRFWYEDQHPFMFVLMGLVFLFTGPGDWSLDRRKN